MDNSQVNGNTTQTSTTSVEASTVQAKQSQQQKNVKDMTIEEQVAYYKSFSQKSKKLNLYYEEENKKLKERLNQYESEDGKVCEFLFKFKYENCMFYFFKNEKSYYFVNEKVLDESFRQGLNSNENIKIYDYGKDLKAKDETISQIINQYEDKMKRLSNELELGEKRIMTLNEKNKKLQKEMEEVKMQVENEKKVYEQSIKEIIQTSNEIFIQIKNSLEVDLTDETLKQDVYCTVKDAINTLNKPKENEYSKWLIELRSYISKTLFSFLDVIFKSINQELVFDSQKQKWQNTIDQIILSHEEEKNKMFKALEQYKINMTAMNQKINLIEQEKYNLAKQKDQTIEILNREINKGVNVNYLKNVLISFFTTKEESIQEGLLPVVFTALQFNDSEIKKVQESRSKKSGLFDFFK